MEEKVVFSVSQLNNLIKHTIDAADYLKFIVVRGELQGFKRNSYGDYYFTLIENGVTLSASIRKYKDKNYDKTFKEGDLVEVTGSVIYWNNKGRINFEIYDMKLCGDGDNLLKKQQLLQKLNMEGLFDPSIKLPIPKFPKKIGVITSLTGAAIEDIKKNIFKRYKLATLYIFPCIVQGQEAKNSIISAINRAKEYNLDVVIIGRGGGSKDDLSAFDEESVARTLFDLKIPKVAAIGHEIDKSVCDFICDVSVSTPTAAAEEVTTNIEDVIYDLNENEEYLNHLMKNKIDICNKEIENIANNKLLDKHYILKDNFEKDINELEKQLKEYYLSTKKLLIQEIEAKDALIEAFNPNNILDKGYSIIYDKNRNILTKINEFKNHNELIIQVSDGEIIYKGEVK